MKKFALVLIIAAAVAGCSDTEQVRQPAYTQSDVPIGVGASFSGVTGEGRTRSVYQDIPSGDTAPLEARVIATLDAADFASGTIGDGTINFIANAPGEATQSNISGFTPAVGYPANAATPVYLAGFYPSDGWTISSGRWASHSVDGKTDIMSAAVVTTYKTDAMSSPTSYRNLAFTHQLTLLNIYMTGETGTQSAWGNVTGLSVTKMATGNEPATGISIYLDESDGIPVNSSTTAPLKTFVWDGSSYTDTAFPASPFPIPSTTAMVAYALVPPMTVASGTNDAAYTFEVTTVNGGTRSVTVSLNSTFAGSTAGVAFDIRFKFKAFQINASATAVDWADGGTASGYVP